MTEPKSYALASWLFLRLLGAIYLIAFVSLATQIRGLAGSDGILPAAHVLDSKRRRGIVRFWRQPTLCWLSVSDGFLLFLSWGGAVLAFFLMVGFAQIPTLVLLWVFYLSLFNVCRLFLGYQWDVLLLETGFVAIFLAPKQLMPSWSMPSPSPVVLWLLRWLLFRLMFSSGFVKLRSRDPAWRKLTALCHHYQTQPLPTSVAWYVHQLPAFFQKTSTAAVLLVEIVGPILIFGPPVGRHAICGLFIGLMLLVELTGNYAFFNLLGAALSLLLLDDDVLRPWLWWSVSGDSSMLQARATGAFSNPCIDLIGMLVILLSLDVGARLFRRPLSWPKPLLRLLDVLAPFHLVSAYGLFAVMTAERPEIIVEGSNDGVDWLPYEFKWKPGKVNCAPRFVAPHQPRLDWQMWFAALGYCENNTWFVRFLERLLEGSKPVARLLKHDPFRQKPPRYVRGSLYDYQFTNWAQQRQTGGWWCRERRGTYCPAVGLNDLYKVAREEMP